MAFQDLDTALPRDDNSIDPNRSELRDLKTRLKEAEQNNFGLTPLKTGDVLRSSRYFMDLQSEGFLPASGQELSRTEYADLFAEIGTGYGAGDGSTTFNAPDDNEGFFPIPPGTWEANPTGNQVNITETEYYASPARGRRAFYEPFDKRIHYETPAGEYTLISTVTGAVYISFFYDDNDELNWLYKLDSAQAATTYWNKYNETTQAVEVVNNDVKFYLADKTTASPRGSNSKVFYTSNGIFAIESLVRDVFMWDDTINSGAGGFFLVDTISLPDFIIVANSSPNYAHGAATIRFAAGYYKIDFSNPTSIVVTNLGIPTDPDTNLAYYAADFVNAAYWVAINDKWYRRTDASSVWELTALVNPYADAVRTKVAASEGTNSLYMRPINAALYGEQVTPLADSAPKVLSFVKT